MSQKIAILIMIWIKQNNFKLFLNNPQLYTMLFLPHLQFVCMQNNYKSIKRFMAFTCYNNTIFFSTPKKCMNVTYIGIVLISMHSKHISIHFCSTSLGHSSTSFLCACPCIFFFPKKNSFH